MEDAVTTTVPDLRRVAALHGSYDSLLAAATETCILLATPEGTIQLFNPGAERLLGYAAADAVGRSLLELLHDPAEVARRAAELGVAPGFEVLQAAGRRGEPETREWTYVRSDGARLRVLLSVTALRDELGRSTAYMVVANDVTERRQAEESLRLLHGLSSIMEQAADFESALEVALAEICSLTGWAYGEVWLPCAGGDGLERSPIFYAGARELAALASEGGAPRVRGGEGLPGRVWESRAPVWIPDLTSEADVPGVPSAGATGLRVGVGVPVLAEDEVVAVIAFYHFEPRQEDGQLMRFISTVGAQLGTVVRRKQAEEALQRAKVDAEEASRTKSEFLARMSHELRTPLNSVIGFTNVLLKNRAGNLRSQDLLYLERVAANGRHLLDLINDILDLSKVEAGKMEYLPAPTALQDLVAATVAELPRRPKGVKLVTEVPPGLPPVETDGPKLKQVLINLVSNALRFTEKGSVTLRVLPQPEGGRGWRIEVADTGIGIPAERQDAIFGAFQQADTGTSRKYGGTGLGLAISRSLCHLLGCELSVRSTVGVGSVFTIVHG